jgi:hypothetical protein
MKLPKENNSKSSDSNKYKNNKGLKYSRSNLIDNNSARDKLRNRWRQLSRNRDKS